MHFHYNRALTIPAYRLIYDSSEYSLRLIPYPSNTDIGILCGEYTELSCIGATGKIMGLSGYSHKNGWISKKIVIPKASKGELYMHFSTAPIKGSGIEYRRDWSTHFDSDTNWICIGETDINDTDCKIEFVENLIAVLRNDVLISIFGKVDIQ